MGVPWVVEMGALGKNPQVVSVHRPLWRVMSVRCDRGDGGQVERALVGEGSGRAEELWRIPPNLEHRVAGIAHPSPSLPTYQVRFRTGLSFRTWFSGASQSSECDPDLLGTVDGYGGRVGRRFVTLLGPISYTFVRSFAVCALGG
jgi:hypothetical protein